MSEPAKGMYTGTALADKTFYGFKLDNATGDLTVEIINDGTTTVVLPDENITDPTGYKTYVWSEDTFRFTINSSGHLLLEML